MKTKPLAPNTGNATVKDARPLRKSGLPGGQSDVSRMRTERSRIQWPTERQMQDVSKQLVRIGRAGRRCELAGDYFKSGDLAYQMQEIIRATGELFKKSQRSKD